MALRKKKTLLDQAHDYVDAVRPHVESAVVTTKEAVEGFVETTALPAWEDAKEKAGPAVKDARAKAAPLVADARAKAAPVVADVAARAQEAAAQAKEAADARVATLRGEEPEKKGGKLKKFSLFAAVAGAVGFVAKKLQGGQQTDNWQSSYVPKPAPASPAPAPWTTRAAAAPDEAIADAADEPAPGHHAGRPRRGRGHRRVRRRAAPEGPKRGRAHEVSRDARRALDDRRTAAARVGCSSIQTSIRSHQPNNHSIRSSRSAGISARGTLHQRMTIRLSIGSSRQMSPTVSTWSRPVCATRTTSASGAASSAARNPPGRGASTLVIGSARSAILSRPSLRSRSMPRLRRPAVKLPPSGKITNASFSSRPVARSAICSSRSCAAGRA